MKSGAVRVMLRSPICAKLDKYLEGPLQQECGKGGQRKKTLQLFWTIDLELKAVMGLRTCLWLLAGR